MPDDLSQAMSLEAPLEPEPQAAPEPDAIDDDAEPEGAVEVAPGRRMVDVSVVAAERKRAREIAERRVREKELAPLEAKAKEADALRQALDAARPYVDFLKQRPDLLQQQPQSYEDTISEEEAEQEARELQLYGSDSTLDTRTAKRVIARRRQEAAQVAQQAVQQAVGPMQQTAAERASRENFAEMAQLMDGNGQPLVDPRILAEEWVQMPVDLTQHRNVAEVVLERAIGKSLRMGRRTQAQPQRATFSEPAGGRGASPLVLSPLDRKLGLTEKDLKESAKGFVPGGISQIGD